MTEGDTAAEVPERRQAAGLDRACLGQGAVGVEGPQTQCAVDSGLAEREATDSFITDIVGRREAKSADLILGDIIQCDIIGTTYVEAGHALDLDPVEHADITAGDDGQVAVACRAVCLDAVYDQGVTVTQNDIVCLRDPDPLEIIILIVQRDIAAPADIQRGPGIRLGQDDRPRLHDVSIRDIDRQRVGAEDIADADTGPCQGHAGQGDQRGIIEGEGRVAQRFRESGDNRRICIDVAEGHITIAAVSLSQHADAAGEVIGIPGPADREITLLCPDGEGGVSGNGQ